MGAPPSEDQIAEMLSNPEILQTMNEALNNPAFVEHMLQANPMLASMPNAREMLQSPSFRNMIANPEALMAAARMRRLMGGQGGAPAFPAPGVTDTTPDIGGNTGAAGGDRAPPLFPGMAFPFAQAGGDPVANPFSALFGPNPFGITSAGAGAAGATNATPTSPSQAGASGGGAGGAGAQGHAGSTAQAVANPFAALFGAPGAQGVNATNPLGLPPLSPEAMQQMMQMWGLGSPTSPAAPADNRPPEERYAEQLRQLNDMGFFDFDRNIAALRRSGGSVQGAIEHLLNGS